MEWSQISSYMRFSTNYMNIINAIYDYYTVKIRPNGILSQNIYPGRGTHQGCPLSPLFFAIAFEPLLMQFKLVLMFKVWILGVRSNSLILRQNPMINMFQTIDHCTKIRASPQSEVGLKKSVEFGFAVSMILSTSFYENQLRWSKTGPEDGQKASNSLTVSRVDWRLWQSVKTYLKSTL